MAERYRHPRDNRIVRFTAIGRIDASGVYDSSAVSPEIMRSGDIDTIKNRDLRLALQLADIVQALDLMERSPSEYYGGVRADIAPPRLCERFAKGNQQFDQVESHFPDDLFDQFEQFHENEQR